MQITPHAEVNNIDFITIKYDGSEIERNRKERRERGCRSERD